MCPLRVGPGCESEPGHLAKDLVEVGWHGHDAEPGFADEGEAFEACVCFDVCERAVLGRFLWGDVEKHELGSPEASVCGLSGSG